MVLILRSLHSDFDHVRDQVLAGDLVPSMDSLITRLLRVPHVLGEAVTIEEVVVEDVDVLIALIARGWATFKRIVTHCMVFLKE